MACRRAGSPARAFSLVVVLRIDLDRAEETEDARLLAAGDELLQRPWLRRPSLGARPRPAGREGALQQVPVDCRIGSHVRLLTQDCTMSRLSSDSAPKSAPKRRARQPSALSPGCIVIWWN